jgi:hypothetical protein
MATTTFLGGPAVLTIGGTDVTDNCSAFTAELGYASLDITAFGDAGSKMAPGLQTVSGSFTLFASYGAGEIEAVLNGEVGQGDTVIVFKKDNAAISASNPEITISNTMIATAPYSYTQGEMQVFEVTFEGGTWSRDITP